MRSVYLDWNATTPLHPDVASAMREAAPGDLGQSVQPSPRGARGKSGGRGGARSRGRSARLLAARHRLHVGGDRSRTTSASPARSRALRNHPRGDLRDEPARASFGDRRRRDARRRGVDVVWLGASGIRAHRSCRGRQGTGRCEGRPAAGGPPGGQPRDRRHCSPCAKSRPSRSSTAPSSTSTRSKRSASFRPTRGSGRIHRRGVPQDPGAQGDRRVGRPRLVWWCGPSFEGGPKSVACARVPSTRWGLRGSAPLPPRDRRAPSLRCAWPPCVTELEAGSWPWVSGPELDRCAMARGRGLLTSPICRGPAGRGTSWSPPWISKVSVLRRGARARRGLRSLQGSSRPCSAKSAPGARCDSRWARIGAEDIDWVIAQFERVLTRRPASS